MKCYFKYLISVIHPHGNTTSASELKHLRGELATPISWSKGDFKNSWPIYNKISCTVLKSNKDKTWNKLIGHYYKKETNEQCLLHQSWDTSFSRHFLIHTGPTPPLTPEQCWARVSRIFSDCWLCIGRGEEELQEHFEKDALFHKGTQNCRKTWILHYCGPKDFCPRL